MKQWNWLTECNKYSVCDIEWLTMAINIYDNSVIIEAKEMIHECLKCEYHKQWCRKWYNIVKDLDINLE